MQDTVYTRKIVPQLFSDLLQEMIQQQVAAENDCDPHDHASGWPVCQVVVSKTGSAQKRLRALQA